MRVILIAAVAENDVIGVDGEMPWQYPADLQHFKERTLGSPVIVGRVTYEAIERRLGGPLPERTTVVLTHSPDRIETSVSGVRVAMSVDEALDLVRQEGESEVFVAGGESVYEQFLPLADRLLLTEIPGSYDGDAVFPSWDRNEWRELKRDDRDAISFVTYSRDTD